MLVDHCWNQALDAVDLYPPSPTKLKKSRKLSTRMTLGFKVRGIFLWWFLLNLRLDYSMAYSTATCCRSREERLDDFTATCRSREERLDDFTATCRSREEQMKLETIKTLAMDSGNEDVISDFMTFVNGKKFYKRKGKTWKRGYLLYEPPGSDGASLIAAMADFLEFKLYNLDLASFSSFSELKNTLLVGTWSSSVIAIRDLDDFDHCAGMLPNLKNELTGSCLLEFVNGLLSSCGDEQIIVFTTNNRDRHDAARRRRFNEDIYVHKSSPQPVALADEGEIVQLDSSRRKPLVDLEATNNKAYQGSLLVSNLEEKNTREASTRRCMTESMCSFVDSMTSISSTDFDALDNRAHLGRAYQSGPIVFNSEKKDTREGLSGECLTKSALSFDDSIKRKSLPFDVNLSSFSEHASQDFDDFDFVGFDCGSGMLPNLKDELDSSREKPLVDFDAPNIKVHGLLVSNSEEKNMREASTRRFMTESVCSLVDSMPSISSTDFDALDNRSHLGRAFQSGPIVFNSEQKDTREGLSGQWLTKSAPSFDDKQKLLSDVRILASLELTSQDLYDFDDFDGFDHCVGSLLNLEDESTIGLPDGGHILYLPEKKIVRKTLKRKCRSISVLSLEDRKQHVDRRWEDAAKSHGAKRFCRQLGIHRLSTAKRTHKQHGIHQWPFQRSAIGLPDGQHVLPLSEKKMVRKKLKRKCISMSVLSLVDRQRHVNRRWEDATKNIGVKRICRQLVIHRVSIAKRICRQHGIHHRWPFERDWATMKGYSLGDERPVEVISLSTHAKLVPRLQLIYISWLGRFSPRPSALAGGGEIGGPIALSLSESAATKNIAQRVGHDQSGSAASDSENERTREQGDPEEINATITLHDIRRHYGRRNREDAAASLAISVATFKRKCREFGIKRWPHVRKRKVGRPPDQHGEGNTSTARETPSHHVQTGMGGEPVGQNQEANVLRQDFMGGPIALNIDSGSIMVVRPPDQHGEKNTSTACEVPSHNVETGMEIEPVGQNQEANVFRRDFTEGPTALNTENGLIIGSSSEQASQVNDQSTLSTPYQNHNALVFPQPQITSMLSENRGGSIDWGNSLASQAEPFSDTHISGSSNLAFPTWSDQAAPSQHVEGQSMQSTVYPDHNAVHHFLEGHVFESINWNEHTNSLASQAEPFSDRLISRSIWRPPDQLEGQTMQFTTHPNPNALGLPQFQIASFQVPSANEAPSQPVATILTERQGLRSVKVKATYGNGNRLIKFPLPLTSGIKELMQEVSKTLDWELGSFDVDYKDEDGDWILMARDDNVSEYLQLLNSIGNQATKLEVRKKVPDTTNICETCGSSKQQRP